MNLEELVPPLELCKKIPAGEFEDSALCWVNIHDILKFMGFEIDDSFCVRETDFCKKFACNRERFPAPTLQEIMKELPASNIYRIRHMWTANFINDSVNNGIKSTNPATAALKLWLKLKGIEA